MSPSPEMAAAFLSIVYGPRGLTKLKAKIDLWLKEIAPSSKLRKWFGHDPEKWRGFRARYEKELMRHRDELDLIKRKARKGRVTLVHGARSGTQSGGRVTTISREAMTAV